MNLVTGAAGHVGNVLIRALLKRGEKVRALVLPNEDLNALEGLDIDIVEGNILDVASLQRAAEGVDTIFHLAALISIIPGQENLLRAINIDGTRNVIQVAKAAGVKRLVYTSSIHALTRPPEGVMIDEKLPFDPQNPAGAYDRTKAEASLLVQQAVAEGLNALIVCPTGVIGPYDFRRSEMGEMVLSWMKRQVNFLIKGFFDFVDVRDVAQGHILARDFGKAGETYILGGERIAITRMEELVQTQMGYKSPRLVFPTKLALLIAPLAEWYYRITHKRPRFTRYSIETVASNSHISSQKAKIELGYTSRRLTDSLKDTVRWWIENLKKTKASLRI